MNLDHLVLFLEVAHRGSFAAVARDRSVDPSSVSRAIAVLEEELELRLFHRSTRRMTLTEAGEVYLARIEPVAEEIARARNDASALGVEPEGLLRLSASVAFGQCRLVPLLPALRERYPRLRVALVLTDRNVDLVAEGIDLAIRLAPSVCSDQVALRLAPTRYHVVAAPGWVQAHGVPRTPVEVAHLRCLLFDLPEHRRSWMFRDANGVLEEVAVGGDITLTSALALREAVLHALGPALLADWLIGEDVARGDLVDLFPHHHATANSFDTAAWLLYPSRTFMPHKVRAASDFLHSHLGPAGGA